MARRKKGGPVSLGKVSVEDLVKAQRRAAREVEIALHGRPVMKGRMLHKSRKAYDRRREKRTGFEDLSSFSSRTKEKERD